METRKQQDLTTKKIEIGVSCYNSMSATNHFGCRIIYGTCDYNFLNAYHNILQNGLFFFVHQ